MNEASDAPTPDGKSWAKAFRDLQDGIAAAGARLNDGQCSPAAVWVAAGVYAPGPAGARDKSFELKSGLQLYGGFAGTEATIEERDLAANVTTLSGDLGRDDQSAGTGEDAYHIVIGSFTDSTTVLDGFTIESAYANGPFPNDAGGGIYLKGSQARLRNLVVRGAYAADNGGGIYIERGAPVLSHVDFPYDTAGRRGGGFYAKDTSLVLSNVTFTGDHAGSGAGFYAENTTVTVTGALFDTNFVAAANEGPSRGAAFWAVGGTVRITAATFHGNVAYGSSGDAEGGAVSGTDGAQLRIVKSTFDTNYASANTTGNYSRNARGGAIAVIGGALAVTSVQFMNDKVEPSGMGDGQGGSVYADGADVTIANSLFFGGGAQGGGQSGGGALFATPASATVVLVNSTLTGIATPFLCTACPGGTVTGPITVANSVFWGTAVSFAGSATVTHSCVEGGGYDETQPGETNRDDCVVSGNGLAEGSPGIDQADLSLLPKDEDDLDGDGDLTEPLPLDLVGQQRQIGAGLDMGAYENGTP